jgi:hypothetical protein
MEPTPRVNSIHRNPPKGFTCACGKVVDKKHANHFRCKECAKEALQDWRGKQLRRRFPVFNQSLYYLVSHLNENIEYDQQRRENEEQDKRWERLAKELQGPSPCAECRWKVKCAEKKLACRAFWAWSNESNKKQNVWEKITEPCGRYYDRCFPRDTRQTTMRRVV